MFDLRLNASSLKTVVRAALCIAVLSLWGCASAADTAGEANKPVNEYRPRRVEVTGSLISRPATAYRDEDDAGEIPSSPLSPLNGNPAMSGIRPSR